MSLDPQLVAALLQQHRTVRLPRLRQFWAYYRNPGRAGAGADQLAQAAGLPRRLRDAADRREIVIENDIAWRLHAMVDFLFGKPPMIQSTLADARRGERLQRFVCDVIAAHGGPRLFADLGLLGSVYGHVDVLVRPGPAGDRIVLDVIEPTRAVPLTSPDDYRQLDAYLIHQSLQWPVGADAPPGGAVARTRDRTVIWTARTVTRLDGRPDASPRRLQWTHPMGRVPVVHIQNLPQPFVWEGLSEVEPLIPLQDELNTRLSDRANRVTFQSFKMYLGKGIDGFLDRPVGPGQMWATDNPEAVIEEFGGDAASPGEDAHIAQLREAMDKISGVSPLVAGLVGGRIGNLTSENALRVVLLGMLARTQRKRASYGEGIARLYELILHAADAATLLPNAPEERGVRIDWPNPIPEDEHIRLREAQLKLDLGVPRPQVLAELGYTP